MSHLLPLPSNPNVRLANTNVTFRGGLEMLFSDKRRHTVAIPAKDKDGKPATIASLIDFLCKNTMKDSRKELFVLDKHLYVWFTALHPTPINHRPPLLTVIEKMLMTCHVWQTPRHPSSDQ